MAKLATAAEAFAHLDALIASLDNRRHQQMLAAFRTHWHGEVSGDLDAAMSVVHPNSRFSVLGALPSGAPFEVTSATEHRAIYQVMPDLGLNAGGSFSDMRFAFAEWGIVMEAIYSSVVFGSMLTNVGEYDPNSLFLFHAPLVMLCTFDEDVQMIAKRDYFGQVSSVEPADRETLRRLTAL